MSQVQAYQSSLSWICNTTNIKCTCHLKIPSGALKGAAGFLAALAQPQEGDVACEYWAGRAPEAAVSGPASQGFELSFYFLGDQGSLFEPSKKKKKKKRMLAWKYKHTAHTANERFP